jgi:hypothetical protein
MRPQQRITDQRRPGEGFERIAEELRATGVILDKGRMQKLLKTQVQLRALDVLRHREDAAGGPRV